MALIKKTHMRIVFWHPKKQTTPQFNRLTVSGSLNCHPIRNRDRWIFIRRIIQRKIGTTSWFREIGNFRDLELRFIPISPIHSSVMHPKLPANLKNLIQASFSEIRWAVIAQALPFLKTGNRNKYLLTSEVCNQHFIFG